MIKKISSPLLILLVFFILLSGNKTYSSNVKQTLKDNPILKIAFPSLKNASHYEPTKIQFLYEYLFLDNIYSTLIEINPKGQLAPAIAEKFFWEGNNLHLIIRSDIKSQNGTPITAQDVEFSLKRLLILSEKTKNTHGNFKDLLDPNIYLGTIEENCTAIRSTQTEVILRVKGSKHFLLPMLTSIDFVIIPKSSIDPLTLEIINYKETSGLYYVHHDNKDGNITLKINPYHFHASENLAQTIKLIPFDLTDPNKALELFDKGDVDHLTICNGTNIENLVKYSANHPDTQIYSTLKIKKFMLVFTERVQQELTIAQRRWIGKQIRDCIPLLYQNQTIYDSTDQFFIEDGYAALTKEELIELNNIEITQVPLQKFRIGLIGTANANLWKEPIQLKISEATVYQEFHLPDLHNYNNLNEMPHAFIGGTEAGYIEDINLITYNLNVGIFGLNKSEREKWLIDYMKTEDSMLRTKILSNLHYQALKDAICVPLVACPYTAIVRKPWHMTLSNLFPDNHVWLIKQIPS